MEPEETLEELAERDWYGWLKVEITASLIEIKKAFLNRAKQVHPDKKE